MNSLSANYFACHDRPPDHLRTDPPHVESGAFPAKLTPRAVDPPVQVEMATWTHAGQFDWWVKDRLEWFGRARGKDGMQRWIKPTDLRPASGSQP